MELLGVNCIRRLLLIGSEISFVEAECKTQSKTLNTSTPTGKETGKQRKEQTINRLKRNKSMESK
jgi:hypothetical protein